MCVRGNMYSTGTQAKGNNKGNKIESWSVPVLFNSKDDKMATSPLRISHSYGNFYSAKVQVLPIGLCSAI